MLGGFRRNKRQQQVQQQVQQQQPPPQAPPPTSSSSTSPRQSSQKQSQPHQFQPHQQHQYQNQHQHQHQHQNQHQQRRPQQLPSPHSPIPPQQLTPTRRVQQHHQLQRQLQHQHQQFSQGVSPELIEQVGVQLLEVCRKSGSGANDAPHLGGGMAASLSQVESLVEACPEATVYYKDSDERTVIHTACANKVDLPILSVMVTAAEMVASQSGGAIAYPLGQPTSKGLLPLHYACREQAPVEVIRYLVDVFPNALRHATQSGWLPLHLACAKQAPLAIIQYLASSWPESVQRPTKDGRLALHFACANPAPSISVSLSVVQFLLKYYPQAIGISDDVHDWNPLHIVCAYTTSLPLLEYLVNQWKEGLLVKEGKHGRLPLHIACAEKRPKDMIQFLVFQNLGTVQEPDQHGNLPLMIACDAGCSVDAIKFLIQAWPMSAWNLGQTPSEMAAFVCRGGTPTQDLVEWMQRTVSSSSDKPSSAVVGNVRAVSRMSPASTPQPSPRPSRTNIFIPPSVMQLGENTAGQHQMMTNANLSTTVSEEEAKLTRMKGEKLHQACEFPQNLDTIQSLVESFPKCIAYKSYGILPMHTACINHAPLQVIEYLCGKYPDSLNISDSDGNLPLHLACYSSASLDSIQYLVLQCPESLSRVNSQGDKAVDRARNPFYDNPNEEVIRWLDQALLQSNNPALATSMNSTSSRRGRIDPAQPPNDQRPTVVVLPTSSSTSATAPTSTMTGAAGTRPTSTTYRPAHGTTDSSGNSNNDNDNGLFPEAMGSAELRLTLNALRDSKKPKDHQQSLDDSTTSIGSSSNETGSNHNRATLGSGSGGGFHRSPIGSRSARQISRLPRPDPYSRRIQSSGDKSPGIVAVNEPGMNPNSPMYRAAYGGDPQQQQQQQQQSQADGGQVVGGVVGGGQQQRRRSSFKKPLGVEETRAMLDALRAQKRTSRRQTEMAEAASKVSDISGGYDDSGNGDDFNYAHDDDDDDDDSKKPQASTMKDVGKNLKNSDAAATTTAATFGRSGVATNMGRKSPPHSPLGQRKALASKNSISPPHSPLGAGGGGGVGGVPGHRRNLSNNLRLSPKSNSPLQRQMGGLNLGRAVLSNNAMPNISASVGDGNNNSNNITINSTSGTAANHMPEYASTSRKKPPPGASSFYQAALQESQMMEREAAARLQNLSASNTTTTITTTTTTSSSSGLDLGSVGVIGEDDLYDPNSNNNDMNNNIRSRRGGPPSTSSTGHHRPAEVSSFYRAALEASSGDGGGSTNGAVGSGGIGPASSATTAATAAAATSSSAASGMARRPNQVSSFYRHAMSASLDGNVDDTLRNITQSPPSMPTSVPATAGGRATAAAAAAAASSRAPSAAISSFYRAAMEARDNDGNNNNPFVPSSPTGGLTDDDRKPSAVYVPPSSSAAGGNFHSRSGGTGGATSPTPSGGTGGGTTSSFYREAMEAANLQNDLITTGGIGSVGVGGTGLRRDDVIATTAPASRPGVVQVNEPAIHPNSAMYHAAYHTNTNNTNQAQQVRPGAVAIDEPVVRPDAVVYQMAYGTRTRGGGNGGGDGN